MGSAYHFRHIQEGATIPLWTAEKIWLCSAATMRPLIALLHDDEDVPSTMLLITKAFAKKRYFDVVIGSYHEL